MGEYAAGKPSLTDQPLGSLIRVPASAGEKGGNLTSARWHVTLCDPMWYVSSHSGEAFANCYIHFRPLIMPISSTVSVM